MNRPATANPDSARVVPFRARGSEAAGEPETAGPQAASPVEDTGKYERSLPEEPDDYRHRMLVNAVGLVICGVLIFSGVWIANKMADVRRVQDCALSGRRNCAPIEVDHLAR
jgi:hypothetical protein